MLTGDNISARELTSKSSEKINVNYVLPVSYEADVVVVGGGPAGVSAAFAAAKMGKSVLVVEQFNCLGGVATAGGHGHICLYSTYCVRDERIVGGFTYEIGRRVDEAGYGRCTKSSVDFEIEGMKLVLEQMAEELGVNIMYHTFFSDAIVEDGRITSILVQNKNGLQVIKAKQFIDCTGDGDLAARAGCQYELGEEGTGHCQPVTLMFTIGGVDYAKVKDFRGNDYKLHHVWKAAQDNGDMRPFQDGIMGWWWSPTRPDQLGINFTHVSYVDCTKAEDLTYATVEARKQAYETIEVYKKYVPGMEDCYMVSTPNTIGTRESRRITGEYTLTKDDVVGQKDFEDSIGYGSFFIDIHNCSGPGMDKKTKRPEPGFRYQIPYRIMLPVGMKNLLVAGRCVSVDHEALGSLRVMPQCGVMGQAAGVAACMSIDKNIEPKAIVVRDLQVNLKEQGCIVDIEDIKKHNA
jgi:hypothetical protein